MRRLFISALAFLIGGAAYGCRPTTAGDAGETRDAGPDAGSSVEAQWAATPVTTNGSIFGSVAPDSSGDVYVTGIAYVGEGILDLGNGVSLVGSDAGDTALLAKYDSEGVAQWVQTPEGTLGYMGFMAAAVDASNGVYAVGCFAAAAGTVSFGPGVTVTEPSNFSSAVLVKYDATGAAKWARTVSGPDSSCFNSLAIDSIGNLYVAGGIGTVGVYDFGNGVEATSTVFIDGGETGLPSSLVLVKYSPEGVAQWAQTSEGLGPSGFNSLALDSASNLYALGDIAGGQTYDFGGGVTVTPPLDSLSILVKYNASGVAQWARSSAGWLFAVAVDPAGEAVVSGTIEGSQALDFGNGVTAIGKAAQGVFTGTVPAQFLVVAKYDSAGSAEWARTAVNAGGASYFFTVAIDSAGDVLAAGTLFGPADYDFGNGVDAQAPGQSADNSADNGEYGVLVNYDPLGIPQWARVSAGQGSVTISSVAVDAHDDFFVSGGIGGSETFGNGVECAGAAGDGYSWSALLVKYR